MTSRLSHIDAELLSVRSSIESIEAAAAAESRDLNTDESAEADALFARHETLKSTRATVAARESSLAETAALNVRAGIAIPNAQGKVEVTAGEWLSLYARSKKGDRQAEALLARTVATQAVADLDGTLQGIVPTPIVGNLIKFNDSNRPVFNSMTSRPMPSAGKSFTRPRITQRVLVAETTELTEFPSRKMVIADDTVTKRKFAGQLEISEESIDWTDPAFLDLALQDFADFYNEVTEDAACDFLENLPASTTTYSATTIEAIVQSYVNAVLKVYTQSKKIADTVWLPIDDWGTLVAQTGDNSDDSAVVALRAALGQFGANINFILAPQLSTPVVGVASLVESYEQKKGLVQAYNTNLGALDVAYRGYVAFFGRHEGFTYLGTTQGS